MSSESGMETNLARPFESLFRKRYHVYPLFYRDHFFLSIVTVDYTFRRVNQEFQPRFIKISIWDSLPGSTRPEAAKIVFKEFYQRRISMQFGVDFPLERIETISEDSIKQPNGDDCGLFTIYNVWKYFTDLGWNSSFHYEHDSDSIGPELRKIIIND